MTTPEAAPPGVHPSSITEVIRRRRIEEVLHFTTHKGLIGILASKAVLCRDRLETSQHIEYIYTPNCSHRLKDADWTGYVNLSISRVNGRMLRVSSNDWHASDGVWWAVLSFRADLLTNPGVHFTTTNNTYPCVRRGTGDSALEELFAAQVEWGYYGSHKVRYPNMPDWFTTDPQAEVLYPDQLALEHRLQAVYVGDPEHTDHVHGLIQTLDVPDVDVIYRPEVFT